MSPLRLLTLNCHEAWVHQLESLQVCLDIIDGLPGRYTSRWDSRIRPVPRGARLLSLEEVLREGVSYQCVIAHSMTDLLDVKSLTAPRLLVLHNTLESRLQGGQGVDPQQVQGVLRHYLRQVGGHAVAVSALKARSWGVTTAVVSCGVEPSAYPPWSGELACGLRVANQISQKQQILAWSFHQAAFRELPVRLVGHNPEMAGVEPSESWEHLKGLLQSHRFFIHTADPVLEDGYNMAMLEAMAAGLPVLGNCHPTSPIRSGVNGFLSDDPDELAMWGRRLLEDRTLAGRLGEAARRTVREAFPLSRFAQRMKKAIQTARRSCRMG
ncbi:MAG: glycosyltransferase [Magnetococcales bacterium]|nr:glycosyltransferase [Magnetococcales bacterium]